MSAYFDVKQMIYIKLPLLYEMIYCISEILFKKTLGFKLEYGAKTETVMAPYGAKTEIRF